MNKANQIIQDERRHQIDVHGHDPEDDKQYKNNELFNAACCYSSALRCRAINEGRYYFPAGWPFPKETWKPTPEDRIKELAKAGALFMAHQEATGTDCSSYIEMCEREINEILNQQS